MEKKKWNSYIYYYVIYCMHGPPSAQITPDIVDAHSAAARSLKVINKLKISDALLPITFLTHYTGTTSCSVPSSGMKARNNAAEPYGSSKQALAPLGLG